ncbi:RNA polymerase sigma-70 factor, ECF subfamily [Amycolatopsis mediterranei S699]|uniref:RNA polymerase sigma-70 factor, ECF subfamily n=2 Tax=Amycolatopsis mediterranei TaxID=33910 RepID=A0A0H3D5R7_AMYMU|nr:sigma-70 family RNA polymerase sigma factor [Amycolatopsis mediterranei]ADJ45443.1 RNA polymerase sigma-70 factor, ECF subfamily [Amycolatopsis mediterranei U32]AEK42212.1 RNA polymerase sigma-70 factor, ECF subfamily protein [Amycolatopsis mediterranei S699]AFO77155.1 RNA polymerase sigma-70 factor, ECF subfamily [Amycolatopsis mediterranei S699]AGT84283.1 RNA polymerase sigma-70 factor, ECF subfamily [Amycolatopsis mediterranei RB]KDO06023.1 RNA polymerase sigma70 factor [Amycolatopsis me
MQSDDSPDDQAPPTGSDQALWARAAGGDIAAFGELFGRHAGAVWNYAYRLTGSWSAAEDLTSSTFLTAWRRLGDVTLVNESARPWLYTVTGNLARREQRRLGRFSSALSRLPRGRVVRDHAEDVAEQVDADRRLRVVLDAVATLPRAERQAVELCLLGDLSTAAASAVLGITETSVRARISRARGRLRGLLQDATPTVLTTEEP